MNSNSEQLQEWLSEISSPSSMLEEGPGEGRAASPCSRVSPSENAHMVQELLNFIRESFSEDEDCFEAICSQLLVLYLKDGESRLFTLQFLPTMIHSYLIAISRKRHKKCFQMEAFLLAIYSQEILEKPNLVTGEPRKRRVRQTRVPQLSQPSVYHEPSNISLSVLTDSSLNRLTAPSGGSYHEPNPSSFPVVRIGPYPPVERINAENRFLVLTRLLHSVNDHLAEMHPLTVKAICLLASGVSRSGFHFAESELVDSVLGSSRRDHRNPKDYFYSMDGYSDQPRVCLNSVFLQEVVTGVYFAIFNGLERLGLRALDDIHQRAQFNLFPDVLLSTNAIFNSLLENPSGTPDDGPMGVKVSTSSYSFESSPAGPDGKLTPRRRSRTLVTTASLRIKRMPEDIPVKTLPEDTNLAQHKRNPLATIKETAVGKLRTERNAETRKLSAGEAEARMKASNSEVSMEQFVHQQKQAETKKIRGALIRDKTLTEDAEPIQLTDISPQFRSETNGKERRVGGEDTETMLQVTADNLSEVLLRQKIQPENGETPKEKTPEQTELQKSVLEWTPRTEENGRGMRKVSGRIVSCGNGPVAREQSQDSIRHVDSADNLSATDGQP